MLSARTLALAACFVQSTRVFAFQEPIAAFEPASHVFPVQSSTAIHRPSLTRLMATKPGVSAPSELRIFVQEAGEKLVVIDVRNLDANAEPGDQKSLAVAPLPSAGIRPQALHLIWDRESESMPVPDVPKDTPIITHCGGGGRGQLAKDFLTSNGFKNVLNGGGPKETECWAEFGDK